MTVGIDLQEYYISTEWDIMDVAAVRTEKYYPCCEEPYPDIYFYLSLRRKSLFYTGWQAIHIPGTTGVQGGLGPPSFKINKNKCIFNKRTIKFFVSCS